MELVKNGYIVDSCNDGETAMLYALNTGYSYDLAIDSLVRSATMQGSVAAFSDNGCTVSPVTNVDENTAAVAAQ